MFFLPITSSRTRDKIREKLGTDTIDLLQFHVWDDSWADEPEFRDTVEKLKREGMIRSFGLSLNRWEPDNGIKAIRTGLVDVVQVIYNIFDQSPEDELFPLCQEMNIGVIARVPLDEGSLGGKMTLETTFPADDWRARYFGPENLPPTMARVDALRKDRPRRRRQLARNRPALHPLESCRQHYHRRHAQTGPRRQNVAASDAGPLDSALLEKLKPHRWDRKPATLVGLRETGKLNLVKWGFDRYSRN